ncbi:hypothetical protein [Arthrobacter rhombi]|uniref:hypothetical protein n=1 Tax=Arthrobacter rhombi TaxID=71253 RepID=UPI003FD0F0D5
MSRISAINQRYAASSSLLHHGSEVFAVGDPAGARFNAAARHLMSAAGEDGPGLWDDLVGAVRSLRWRLVTHPQPIQFNNALTDGALQVIHQTRRLRGGVANGVLLNELEASAIQVSETDPSLGAVLLRSVEEVGPLDCVVVAASSFACRCMREWLRPLGVNVLTASKLDETPFGVDQAYAVGPPRFFNLSLVTAPVTSEVSFVMPAWFRDTRIPSSSIAAYADGGLHIETRVFFEGDLTEPEARPTDDLVLEDELLPQPVWGSPQSSDRQPSSEEVEATKVLLKGGFALWLDDGDRIRTVDPQQPVGERVAYIDVKSVRPETYLLLRQGSTESTLLYELALNRLGNRGTTIDACQRTWKEKLQVRLDQLGHRAAARELTGLGVRTAHRVRAWAAPNLIRPQLDHDFEQLLQWLGLPIQPTAGNATQLRRTIYQVSAEIREQLETAFSTANLSVLERDGYLTLDLERTGFRGLLATRVVAVAPHTEIVPRYDARVPFIDRSGQWLE